MIGLIMKKKGFIWLIFLLSVFCESILSVNADSETYDWNVYGDTHYSVNVIVENPKLDSPFDVTVRLTLMSKDGSLDYTETEWMQIILDSVDKALHIESEKQNEKKTLRDVGNSWQRTFTFQVSSSEYGIGRGQGIELSIIYQISIDEIDIPRKMTWNHLGSNTDDPMKINLSVPWLTTAELIVVLIIVAVVILLVVRESQSKIRGYIEKRRERKRKEEEKKRKERIIGESFECPYCHTLYDKKLSKCPQCGAPTKLES